MRDARIASAAAFTPAETERKQFCFFFRNFCFFFHLAVVAHSVTSTVETA